MRAFSKSSFSRKDSILKLKFAEAAHKCNELRTGFQQSLNQTGTSSSTGSVSGSGEASSGGVLRDHLNHLHFLI